MISLHLHVTQRGARGRQTSHPGTGSNPPAANFGRLDIHRYQRPISGATPTKLEDMASVGSPEEEVAAMFSRFLKCEDLQKRYAEERKSLIDAEQAASWDSKAKSEASEIEKEAAAIVQAIRERERDDPDLFGNQAGEAVPTARDMGGQFLTNRARIERSKLYEIARNAPKGCHLHIHFNAELYPDVLLRRAQEMDTMFIRSARPLIAGSDLEETEIVFNVLQAGTKTSNVFETNYNPEHRALNSNPWMKFRDFCTEFEQKFETDPLKWIHSKAALGENDVYREDQTLNG